MRRMWIEREGRPKALYGYIESGIPGLVLVRMRPGLWRVAHQVSSLYVGPELGILKAREFAAALRGDIDWTQPASKISSRHGEVSDAAFMRELKARDVEQRWWRRSSRHYGWSCRCRRVFGYDV